MKNFSLLKHFPFLCRGLSETWPLVARVFQAPVGRFSSLSQDGCATAQQQRFRIAAAENSTPDSIEGFTEETFC